MLNPFAAVVRTVRRLVRMRRLEHKHGFPCGLCGAKTFEEAGNLCRGYYDCCGDRMSKEVFHPNNMLTVSGGRETTDDQH